MEQERALSRDGVPAREPADHEVAAGAIAGAVAGVAMWLPAMVASPADLGFFFPLKLVAAGLVGESALDTGNPAAAVLVGALLVGLTSVAFALVFVSILPGKTTAFRAVAGGAVYGAVLFAPAWYVLVRVTNPILFSAEVAVPMLVLHVIYGAVLGLVVPTLRKVLP